MLDIFCQWAKKRLKLDTTPVPEGSIQTVYDEYFPTINGYTNKWMTTGHAQWLHMEENKFGSFDLYTMTKGARPTLMAQYLSQDEALARMIREELRVMRHYKGFNGDVTAGKLQEMVQSCGLPRKHVFRHLNANPQLLERWLEKNVRGYTAPAQVQQEKTARLALKLI